MSDQIVPPTSIETEQAVLGATLVYDSALPLCQEVGLAAEHFYADRHRALYRAVAAAEARGDELAAWASVERLGLVSEALSRAYVSELAARASWGDVRVRAQRVMELANRRAKLEGADLIRQGATELDEARSADLTSEGMALLAQDFAIAATPTSKDELASEIFDYFDDRSDPEDAFPLPWETINKGVLGGLRRGDVTVFGGHTNMGKSWMLDQCLAGFAKQGLRCAIFATEMPRRRRVLRYLASATGISTERLMLKRDLGPEDMKRITKAIPTLPFDYYECHGWSADRIAERVLSSGLDVAAVDTVNKIPGLEKTEVANAAATRFASVAARGDLHVILVSQVNRSRIRDPKGVLPKPLRHDLLNTSALEQHAAQILFIHRDQDDAANVMPTGEIYWDKVRDGYKASIKVEQSPRRLYFFEQDPTPAQQQIHIGKTTTHDVELVA